MASEAEEGRGGNRRKKRSISSEKNVETLVVVDPDMMRYYQNEDIENYVLTVMNMVSHWSLSSTFFQLYSSSNK